MVAFLHRLVWKPNSAMVSEMQGQLVIGLATVPRVLQWPACPIAGWGKAAAWTLNSGPRHTRRADDRLTMQEATLRREED